MKEPPPARWIYLLTALGLLLVGALLLLLFSGAFASLETAPPLSNMPAPATATPVPPRATVEGLMEGSGPTTNPQEGQEGPPRSSD